MICTFCGHSDCNTADLYADLKIQVESLINLGVNIFYSGGYGSFDFLALRVVSELKKQYSHIQNTLVFPYRDEKFISKYTDILNYYDADSLYPFEKHILPRYAIITRNKWMVNASDFVISQSKLYLGGCVITLEYAQLKNKNIIYITT